MALEHSGAAIFYVSKTTLPRMVPDRAGWMSMKSSVSEETRFDWRDDSLRFLVGTPCDPALLALKSSVDLLLEATPASVQAHCSALIGRLAAGLQELGLVINSSPDPAVRSSILSFTTGTRDQDDSLVKRLAQERIIVAWRPAGIRVSPHLYNNESDIDALL